MFSDYYRHKKACKVNCGLFRYCHRIYLGSPVTYLVGWGNLNGLVSLLYLLIKIEFRFVVYT